MKVRVLLTLAFVLATQSLHAQEKLWVDRSSKKKPASSIVKLAEKVSPAVVNIIVTYESSLSGILDSPLAESAIAQGSGFIINANGLTLTNNHVVENAASIRVRLQDKREFDAEVVGTDKQTDLALIRIRPEKKITFPVVPLGDSDSVRVGEDVVAIGNPLGLTHSVTSGIVSALSRRNLAPQGREMYTDFIQTDASINPGNSGGPLINLNGEVIGINTAINRQGQGIGFAIPINIVKVLVPQLHSRGFVVRSWIGVRVQKVSPALAKSFGMAQTMGALVTEVIEEGPAAKSGIRDGDIIIKFRGKDVINSDALPWLAATSTTEKPTKVELFRDGKQISIDVQMEELPEQGKKEAVKSKKPKFEKSVELGISVEPLLEDKKSGVVVTKIEDKSPAIRSGLRRRDLILDILGTTVPTVEDFESEMKKYKPGDTIRFKVLRAGRVVFVAFER